MKKELQLRRISDLLGDFPWISDFFTTHSIALEPYFSMTFNELTDSLGDNFFADMGSDRGRFRDDFILFVEQMISFRKSRWNIIETLSVEAGRDKEGKRENHSAEFVRGEITAIVGPTGSGKSRLLEDIECLARGDSPTGRVIRINGSVPDDELRYSTDKNLVAQLSQNMNFVMDLSVRDFLALHCEARMAPDAGSTVRRIFEAANDLAGEKFMPDTPLTQLSGGQSRALMIADTALLSASPIILIDEIENAGVDKTRSLDLLAGSEKIVLISTHDPVIALSAAQRVIIKNGGMERLVRTTAEEKSYLSELRAMDEKMNMLRQRLRRGEDILF
jgi:ABC-type lipoprotein export system ATPase subunit